MKEYIVYDKKTGEITEHQQRSDTTNEPTLSPKDAEIYELVEVVGKLPEEQLLSVYKVDMKQIQNGKLKLIKNKGVVLPKKATVV